MTKDALNRTNGYSGFRFCHSFGFRHLEFVIHELRCALKSSESETRPVPAPLWPFAAICGCDRCVRRRARGVFLVVNHLFARGSGERVIFHEEDRFFGTNFLAIAAEDAAEHI